MLVLGQVEESFFQSMRIWTADVPLTFGFASKGIWIILLKLAQNSELVQ